MERRESDMIRRNDELHSDIRILSINFVTPGFLIYDATDDVGSLADSLLDDLHLPSPSLSHPGSCRDKFIIK